MTTATCTTMDGIPAAALINQVVRSPRTGIWGSVEYLTPDGWFGIRQPGGGLDEVRAEWCLADPA